MPPFGLPSAWSSSAAESTRQCGVLRGLAERGEVDVVRGAEEPLVGVRVVLGALLEGGEDRAAVVVGDHDREVRARLVRPDHQPGGVVQERHVAHQREVATLGLPRERGTDRGRDGAVDTGQAAVGDDLAAAADVVRRGHQVEVADRVRGADDEVAAGRQRAADRAGDVVRREAGRVDERVELARHRSRRPPARPRARRGRRCRPRPGRVTGVTAYGLVHVGSASSTSMPSRDSSRCTGRDSVGWPKTTTRSTWSASSVASSSR